MYKVLIVDDEYEIRRGLALYFPWRESGFVVAGQAEDGRSAQDFVKANRVDLVLCDIKMPRLSGLDFAKWARQSGRDFKLVFLSAYRKFDFAQEALKYGVKRYLVKPPDFNALAGCLREIRQELDEAAAQAGGPAGAAAGGPGRDEVVATVMTYLEGDPAGATIREAAGLVGFNSHYLSTYLREKTGATFTQHLTRLRMERAARMLRDRRNSMLDVAASLGYTNPKNFSRAFRKYFGQAPRSFRRPRPA